MQKKSVFSFLLLISIQFLILIKSVFAQGYGYFSGFRNFPLFYGGFYSNPIDFYRQFPFWIDAFIIIYLLVMVCKAASSKIEALGDYKEQVGGLFGFAGGLYLSMYLNNVGYSLLNLGPILLIAIVFVALLGIYNWIKGTEEKPGAGFLVTIAILLLALLILFPEFMRNFLGIDLYSSLITLAIVIAILALLAYMLPKLKFSEGGEGDGEGATGSRRPGILRRMWRGLFGKGDETPGEDGGETPGNKRPKKLDVKIIVFPQQKYYTIGNTITLQAKTKRAGRYHCRWSINKIPDEGNHDLTIEYTISPGLTNGTEKKIPIEVMVTDLDSEGIVGTAMTVITIISGSPEVNLKYPNSKETVVLDNYELINAKCELTVQPKDIETVDWYIVPGNVNEISQKTIKKGNLLGSDLNITLDFKSHKNLKKLAPGDYTIIAVAMTKTLNYLKVWLSEAGNPAGDLFYVQLQDGTKPGPTPTVPDDEDDEEPEKPKPQIKLVEPKSNSEIDIIKGRVNSINVECATFNLPEEIVNWYILPTKLPEMTEELLKKAEPITQGKNAILDFSKNKTLSKLAPGIYTIIAVAMKKKLWMFDSFLISENKPVHDVFFLKIVENDEPTSTTPDGEDKDIQIRVLIQKEGKFNLIGSIFKESNIIVNQNGSELILETNYTYYFQPLVSGANMDDYRINWTLPIKDTNAILKTSGIQKAITFKQPGVYNGLCMFITAGKSTGLKIKFNVKKGSTPAPTISKFTKGLGVKFKNIISEYTELTEDKETRFDLDVIDSDNKIKQYFWLLIRRGDDAPMGSKMTTKPFCVFNAKKDKIRIGFYKLRIYALGEKIKSNKWNEILEEVERKKLLEYDQIGLVIGKRL